jgi:prepilin-type N-terminal cleavage/methylation domain-containing protein
MTTHRVRGFTLIELLTVLAIAMVLMLFGFPALHHMILRSQVQGAAQEVSAVVRLARLEAIRRGCVTVVKIDPNAGTVTAFADINNGVDVKGNPITGSNLIYDPPAAAATGTEIRHDVDYIIQTYSLPHNVYFWGAPDDNPRGANVVSGLTPDPAPTGKGPNLAAFNPDGSIQATGAFRIGSGPFPRSGVTAANDTTRNFLQVMIAPQATARIRLEKYNPMVATTDPTKYFEPGNDPATGNPLWQWYY